MTGKYLRVAVIGSGTERFPEWSAPLGKWLAQRGHHLINGGGPGVMEETAKAFASVPGRQGLVIGILPAENRCDSAESRQRYRPLPGYPNPWVDLPVYTHLHLSGPSGKDPQSRNHIIVLTADIVVALPGGDGTRSEIELALEYGKPLLIVNHRGAWEEFVSTRAVCVDTLGEALKFIADRERKV